MLVVFLEILSFIVQLIGQKSFLYKINAQTSDHQYGWKIPFWRVRRRRRSDCPSIGEEKSLVEQLTWSYAREGQLFSTPQPKLYNKAVANSVRRVVFTPSLRVRTNSNADLDFQHKWEIHRRFLQTTDIAGRVPSKVLYWCTANSWKCGHGWKL